MSTAPFSSLSQSVFPSFTRRRSFSSTSSPQKSTSYSSSQQTRPGTDRNRTPDFGYDQQQERLQLTSMVGEEDQLTPPKSGDEHERANAPSQKLVLKNLDGAKEEVKCIPLVAGVPLILGRRGTGQPSNFTDGSIPCPVMSKSHAIVVLNENGKITIADAGSMHGTIVNDRRLMSITPVEIRDGDHITFGKDVDKRGNIHPALRVLVNIVKLSTYRRSSSDSVIPCPLFAKPLASSSSSSFRARSPLPNRSPSVDLGVIKYDEYSSSPILAPALKLGFTTSDEEADDGSSDYSTVSVQAQASDDEGPSSPMNAPTSIAQFNERASQWSAANYDDEGDEEMADDVEDVDEPSSKVTEAQSRSPSVEVIERPKLSFYNPFSTSPGRNQRTTYTSRPVGSLSAYKDVDAASTTSIFGKESLLGSTSSSPAVSVTSTVAGLASFLQSRRGRTIAIPAVDEDEDEHEDEDDDFPEEVGIDFGPGRRDPDEGRWSHHDDNDEPQEEEEEDEIVLAEESEQEDEIHASSSSSRKANPVLRRREKLQQKRKMSEEVVKSGGAAATSTSSSTATKNDESTTGQTFKPSDFLSRLSYITKDLSMKASDTDVSNISNLDDEEKEEEDAVAVAERIAQGTALLLANPDLADSEGSDDGDFEFRGAGWKEVESEEDVEREEKENEEMEEEEEEIEEEEEPMEEIDEFDASEGSVVSYDIEPERETSSSVEADSDDDIKIVDLGYGYGSDEQMNIVEEPSSPRHLWDDEDASVDEDFIPAREALGRGWSVTAVKPADSAVLDLSDSDSEGPLSSDDDTVTVVKIQEQVEAAPFTESTEATVPVTKFEELIAKLKAVRSQLEKRSANSSSLLRKRKRVEEDDNSYSVELDDQPIASASTQTQTQTLSLASPTHVQTSVQTTAVEPPVVEQQPPRKKSRVGSFFLGALTGSVATLGMLAAYGWKDEMAELA